MKRFYNTIWMLALLLTTLVGFSSCMDEDDRIGYDIRGHWFGDMDMWYNGERAQGTEIEFTSGWGYTRGSGVQVDYYRYHAVTSYFNWEVRNRILYLTYDDPNLDCAIVDYSLSYDYFRGYVADPFTLENTSYFSLRNYDRYWDQYGYGRYDYYVKGQTRSADADSTNYHGIRGIYLKQQDQQ